MTLTISKYSRVRNKSTGTFINFWDFFPLVRSYFGRYVYLLWDLWNGNSTFVHKIDTQHEDLILKSVLKVKNGMHNGLVYL